VRLLGENGIFIGLKADADTIYQRIRAKRDRPFLQRGQDLKTWLRQMIADRDGAYAMAEITVDTGTQSPWEAVERIVSYVQGVNGDRHRDGPGI